MGSPHDAEALTTAAELADAGALRGLVVREGMLQALAGIALGLLGAIWLTGFHKLVRTPAQMEYSPEGLARRARRCSQRS